ncbi:ABC transporter ATP-binding protein [Salinibacter ruber]|uniref:ATP-binding cassette subfamily B protein n=1 Tax=Salinibacter ruber TaxID=146919 RepID=A0A9X2QKQ5_9BACT|nr:ABC transporter ATP-binding protein [Salinibacter ruber]MBB4088395.1 ATP-binding cassette subfamily B protein [Salinibacter ruber]MCS3611127.1 ATP-binding cassette subfamily B protein [Salinibacter ruber]MCS3646237.1 ATP-binding cassette subfamily B protein [Salinibacter ruber]MCS3649171.1 ATP-binding cassette subfamily B protein [Salinibacter ruber]MCS3652426.1 ATP-binding cassette subfamily B protein [Salinibacter ruber]
MADDASDDHFEPEDTVDEVNTFDGRLIRRLGQYLTPYAGYIVLALAITLGASFLGPLRPWLVQKGIDNYIVVGDLEGLQYIILYLVLALVGEGILSFGENYLTQWIGQQAIYDLRTTLFRHVEGQSLAYFDRTPVGRVITRTTSDVEALSDALSSGLVSVLGDLFKLVFIAYFMFTLNWMLAVVTLLVMPLMVWVTFWFRRNVREQYRETRKQMARINSFIQEHVTGMHIVQLFNREDEEEDRFEGINDKHRAAHLHTIFYYAIFWPSIEFISNLALAAVLWFGGFRALGGSALTLGVLVAFIQYARQFFRPIRDLSNQYDTLQKAMAGAERVFSLLDTDESIEAPSAPVELDAVEGTIEFENVWFAYEEDDAGTPDWVLEDVSFRVEPGEMAALVGATGAGKSTVMNLLLRFYEIQRGQIRVDGHDIRDLRLRDLREHIGLIPQDVFLFSGSVRRNLTLDDPSIDEATMRRAAETVQADQLIERLPDGYDQDVKERGSSLSRGQRQLLAFVRALLYDPDVMVLDEATSSVDTETEALIQRALERVTEGRTTLAIAHRLSTIQDADKILVMHKGEIRERGTHQELLAADGLYRKLYDLQYADQVAPRGDGARTDQRVQT